MRHFDGSWRWVEGILTNLVGQPAIGGVICNYRDITDARRAEEALRTSEEALIKANNDLEQRVHKRTAELHKANCELSTEIAERTRLEREIIRISEREQRRIGQDLHDGLCQELAAIAFMTRALANRMGRAGSAEPGRIHEIAELINGSVSRCRDVARGLHPVEMDADGLMAALRDLALRANPTIACSFRCQQPDPHPRERIRLQPLPDRPGSRE